MQIYAEWRTNEKADAIYQTNWSIQGNPLKIECNSIIFFECHPPNSLNHGHMPLQWRCIAPILPHHIQRTITLQDNNTIPFLRMHPESNIITHHYWGKRLSENVCYNSLRNHYIPRCIWRYHHPSSQIPLSWKRYLSEHKVFQRAVKKSCSYLPYWPSFVTDCLAILHVSQSRRYRWARVSCMV